MTFRPGRAIVIAFAIAIAMRCDAMRSSKLSHWLERLYHFMALRIFV